MALYTTAQLVEWLADMRRFASRDADRATDLLDLLDDACRVNGHREDWSDTTYEILVEYGLCVGDDPEPFVRKALATARGARQICVDAGLLNEGDYVTDPLPLLQMFLPS